MALYPCRDCNRPLSITAETCPHCGAKEPHAHPKRGAPLKVPLIIGAAALGFWGFISVLMLGDTAPAGRDAPPERATVSEPYTPPDWSHIKTYKQAQEECPDQNNECRRVAVVNEWGAMCSTWLRMETSHGFLPETRDNLDALFNGRLFIRDRGVVELTGSKAETDDLGWHYRYGCRVDTWQEKITGIAVPARADKELEYTTFD